MELKLVTTNDGSHSLYVPSLDEHYHSIHGAVNESLHVFINEGLLRIHRQMRKNYIRIFEVGFGTGLNALLTLLVSSRHSISVDYHSIDILPVPLEIVTQINYPEILKMENRKIFEQLHEASWNEPVRITESLTIHKHLKDITFFQWNDVFDLCYFDAFGPDKQPSLWDRTILESIYQSLEPGGMLVTYSAKGTFMRTLSEIGFIVEKRPGPGIKRHMTAAIKQKV